MFQNSYKAEIQTRWHQFDRELREIKNLLLNNERIDRFETEERKHEFLRRQKTMNYRLNINSFLQKFEDTTRDFLGQRKHLGGEDVDRLIQESIQGATDDIMSTEFFEAGILAARSVGKIDTGIELGTGFLIGADLLLTNHHVIENAEIARDSFLTMGYEDNLVGSPTLSHEFELDPGAFFVTDRKLDFTVVAVKPESINGRALSAYGFHPLVKVQGKIKLGDAVNIIHHPGGNPKRVSFRNNQLIFIKNRPHDDNSSGDAESHDGFCLYLADTLKGSSGAPVFNDRWEVIAVHHAGSPIKFTENSFNILDEQEFDSADMKANEGIRISRVIRAIENHQFGENETHMDNKRQQLFQIWLQKQQPPRESFAIPPSHASASHEMTSHGLKITINITPA